MVAGCEAGLWGREAARSVLRGDGAGRGVVEVVRMDVIGDVAEDAVGGMVEGMAWFLGFVDCGGRRRWQGC